MRVHRIPVHCARCSKTFNNEDERDTHLRELPQCPIEPRQHWDGISESQKRQLAKRVSAKKSKEENWYFIYETLFPNSPRPESPFVEDTHLSEELLALREFAVSEVPGRIAQFVNVELPPDLRPSQESIEAFTQAAVQDVFDMLVEKWMPDIGSNQNQASVVPISRSQGMNPGTTCPFEDVGSLVSHQDVTSNVELRAPTCSEPAPQTSSRQTAREQIPAVINTTREEVDMDALPNLDLPLGFTGLFNQSDFDFDSLWSLPRVKDWT